MKTFFHTVTFCIVAMIAEPLDAQFWTSLNTGTSFTLSGIDVVDGHPDSVYAVGMHVAAFDLIAHGFYSFNGGDSWSSMGIAEYDYSGAHKIDLYGLSKGCIVGGGIKRTTDAAVTWPTAITGSMLAGQLMDVKYVDADNIGAVGQVYDMSYTYYNGVYYNSTNGGATWSEHIIHSGEFGGETDFMALANLSSSVILAGASSSGSGNTLYRSVNGGTNWSALSFSQSVNDLYFFDASTGLLGSSSSIYRTVNGGTTWSNVFTTGSAVNALDFSGNFGMAVCSDGSIYSSMDSGITWVVMTSPVTTALLDVRVVSSSLAYASGSAGTVLRYVNNSTGCTDAAACNYNPVATVNDGSCQYPPSNDQCAGALTVDLLNSVLIDNSCTTVDGIVSGCGNDLMKDVWYNFTYNGGMIHIFTSDASDQALHDTRLAVYSSCDATSPIICSDNEIQQHAGMMVSCMSGLVPGTVYYIQVGGQSTSTGQAYLNIIRSDIEGCTDPTMSNYNSCATIDDGSCSMASFCPADFNGDQVIGVADLIIFISLYGSLCD